MKRLGLLLIVAWHLPAAEVERTLTVRAITHTVSQSTCTYTVQGHAETKCAGDSQTNGPYTTSSGRCETTSTPGGIREKTTYYSRNVVEADGVQYTILCWTGWRHCSSLTDGQTFQATIKGTNMWVTGHPDDARVGKMARIKYRIVDIRPSPERPGDVRSAE